MDELQDKFERADGDRLVDSLNRIESASLWFLKRGDLAPDRAPDLIYTDGTNQFGLEVGAAYYHEKDAQFRWKTARGLPNAPQSWGETAEETMFWGYEPNISLRHRIQILLDEKCRKAYGSKCWLLISVKAYGTSRGEFEEMLCEIKIPEAHSFQRIFLAGLFHVPMTIDGPFRSTAGYFVVEMFPHLNWLLAEPCG